MAGVWTIRSGQFVFLRRSLYNSIYKVQVIAEPADGLIGIKFSNGNFESVPIEQCYYTYDEACAVGPIPERGPSSPIPTSAEIVAASNRNQKVHWVCKAPIDDGKECGAHVKTNLTACWRCHASRPE